MLSTGSPAGTFGKLRPCQCINPCFQCLSNSGICCHSTSDALLTTANNSHLFMFAKASLKSLALGRTAPALLCSHSFSLPGFLRKLWITDCRGL